MQIQVSKERFNETTLLRQQKAAPSSQLSMGAKIGFQKILAQFINYDKRGKSLLEIALNVWGALKLKRLGVARCEIRLNALFSI